MTVVGGRFGRIVLSQTVLNIRVLLQLLKRRSLLIRYRKKGLDQLS